jgi:gluconate 2-dehydrogenase gamma chain
MMQDELSRRRFLIALGEALGIAALDLAWPQLAAAGAQAGALAANPVSTATFLTSVDAADIDAIAAQIIPSDATPGAREAGVVHFIDRALSSFYARFAPELVAQLRDFQLACLAANPDAASFAALPSDRQIEFLRSVEQTPFFERMRLLTLLGMFSAPMYGGNVDGAGWKIIGFEDRHVFAPPFGYYDRDYPGFVIAPGKPS